MLVIWLVTVLFILYHYYKFISETMNSTQFFLQENTILTPVIYNLMHFNEICHTPSVLKYVNHLPSARCEVYMMYIISSNQELISYVITWCDWC